MKPEVSIIICTYNDGKFLDKCIKSILKQTYKNFEIILIDDCSTDNTKKIISKYKDKRIKYTLTHKNTGSISKVRNYGISKASGKYIFFTDGDCYAKRNWIMEGMKIFKKNKHVAIEGKIIYCNEKYSPTLSDKIVSNSHGLEYMTANMAFTKKILEEYKFNNSFFRIGDREIALRIKQKHEIPFSKQIIIYHQKKSRTIKSYLQEAKSVCLKIQLIKRYNDYPNKKIKILYPLLLITIIFPPIILLKIFKGQIRTWNDVKLLPFIYIKAIYIRYLIWKTAISERVFIL